jgi:hypothetical protein
VVATIGATMHRSLLAVLLACALIVASAAVAVAASHDRNPSHGPGDSSHGDGQSHHGGGGDHPGTATLAIIGDIPYGAALIAELPSDIAQINADPAVQRVIHLGDIKDGSSRCDTSYFQARLADFQSFRDPLVYTPGDNEWTDCHRASNGGYTPTERLSVVRRLFFAQPGQTLGGRAQVDPQSDRYPENVRWTGDGVVYGTLHVVGSNDDQAPWFTDRTDPATGAPVPETRAERAAQAREYTAREAANLDWLDGIFDTAERQDAPAVVIGMQADMWDSSAPASALSAFDGLKAVLADRAEAFGKPVLLLEGDSHLFKVDTPAGQPANLTRVVVQGSTNVPHEYLRLHVDPSNPTQAFSCENVVYQTGAETPCPAPLAPAAG